MFAAEQELRFTVPLSAVELERRLATQLRALGAALPLAGATLVGHVKAIVRHPQVGYRMFSLTSFDGEVQVRGALRDGVCAVTCTLNAIVYGITPEALARLCEPVFAVTYAEVVRDGA